MNTTTTTTQAATPRPRWDTMTPEERIAAVTHAASEGITPRNLAQSLRTTRNAILGRAFRSRVSFPSAAPKVARTQPILTVKAKDRFAVLPLPPVETWAPHREPVSLMALRDKQCRWPVGEATGAQQMFCGDRVHKRGYCECHWQMRNRPPMARNVMAWLRSDVAGVPPEVPVSQALAAVIGNGKRSGRGART